MENYLNEKNKNLLEIAAKNTEAYKKAPPFPNICFTDFFNPYFLDNILKEFPDLAQKNAAQFNNKREVKFAGRGENFFGAETKKFMHFLNSEPFLEFLQVLTGIKEPLIGDPYFHGGGVGSMKLKKESF